MAFYANIRALRTEKHLTQSQLARHFNLTASTVCDWENRRSEPSVSQLKDVADFFGVTIDYLVGRTDEFGNVTESPQIDGGLFEDRREVLELYDRLDDEKKDSILSILRGLSEPKKNEDV